MGRGGRDMLVYGIVTGIDLGIRPDIDRYLSVCHNGFNYNRKKMGQDEKRYTKPFAGFGT